MPVKRSQLYRETLAAAFEFLKMAPWETFENDDAFAVVVPGEEHPMIVSIMGAAGEEYGISIHRGASAVRDFEDLLDTSPGAEEVSDAWAIIGMSLTRLHDIPPFGRKFLDRADFHGRRESEAPFFLAKDPAKMTRGITPEETEKCLCVLKGVMKALRQNLLTPHAFNVEEVPTLLLSGDPLDPDVSVEMRSFTVPSGPIIVDLPQIPADLSALPRLAQHWIVGMPPVPFSIVGDDRSMRVLAVMDLDSRLALYAQPALGGITEGVDILWNTFRGQNLLNLKGIPSELTVVGRRLFTALQPTLDALGVRSNCCTSSEPLDELMAGLVERLAQMPEDSEEGFLGDDEDFEDEDDDDDNENDEEEDILSVPDANDLHAWIKCDEQLFFNAEEWIEEHNADTERSLARYYGDETFDTELLDVETDGTPRLEPYITYTEWLLTDYRATERSKTIAEQMLHDGYPAPQLMLLTARRDASPSIYRVESIHEETVITLTDILSGRQVEVRELLLRRSLTPGDGLPARLFAAGGFRLIAPLGPIIPAAHLNDALAFLKDLRMELTPEGVRAKPHLFGRLWPWCLQFLKAGAPRPES